MFWLNCPWQKQAVMSFYTFFTVSLFSLWRKQHGSDIPSISLMTAILLERFLKFFNYRSMRLSSYSLCVCASGERLCLFQEPIIKTRTKWSWRRWGYKSYFKIIGLIVWGTKHSKLPCGSWDLTISYWLIFSTNYQIYSYLSIVLIPGHCGKLTSDIFSLP